MTPRQIYACTMCLKDVFVAIRSMAGDERTRDVFAIADIAEYMADQLARGSFDVFIDNMKDLALNHGMTDLTVAFDMRLNGAD